MKIYFDEFKKVKFMYKNLGWRSSLFGYLKDTNRMVKMAPSQFWSVLPEWAKTPLFLLFGLPFLSFSIYQLVIASPRYESQAQIIVKQPDAQSTMDPMMAMLSGFGSANLNTDTQLVMAYIHSNDMLEFLDSQLSLHEHYSDMSIDMFSRLGVDSKNEAFLKYYQNITGALVDAESGIVTIRVQAFDPIYANKLNRLLVERAEWFINSIGHQLAEEQLSFAEKEHATIEKKLQNAKTSLLEFQQNYNLLDPSAEGVAMQQIAYGIENTISIKRAELRALLSVMSQEAPEVLVVKNELSALEAQRDLERNRLSEPGSSQLGAQLSVGQIVAKYSELKVAMELALQSYTSSLVSLEKSRIEAYRKLQYLVTVEKPTLPEGYSYPNRLYNISLFAVVGLLLFGIVKIVVATVYELKR